VTGVRTRFAPSPTGFLHLGSARTALFAWAFARHHHGVFILRIEDTDMQRSTPAAIQAILDAMQWLALDYDEGPFYQMQRLDRYRAAVADLLERGLAYRCYTTPAELDALRAEQVARGEKPRYDGRWRPENVGGRAHPDGVKPVVRFRNPDAGSVIWDDGVKGRIEIANAELDDLVIARSDGTPTYNFCVVVDDLDMRITHVIRGDDHVNNTPRQINIFRALGVAPPEYAHLPTVLGEDGAKLSKRHGAVGVMEYAAAGFLPDAMVNLLARIGWAHGDAEIFSRADLVRWFELSAISPAPARFDLAKLKWVNQEHLRRMSEPELSAALVPFLEREGLDPAGGPDPGAVAVLLRDRHDTLVAMAAAAHYFYAMPGVSAEALRAHITTANQPVFTEVYDEMATLPWTREAIAAALKAAAVRHQQKPGQVMMPLRVLVAGTTATPAIDAVLALLGRAVTRSRIASGLERLTS